MPENDLLFTTDHAMAVLDQTPNGVLVVDKKTVIRYVNPSFYTMFHCVGEAVSGQPAAKFLHSDCFERAIAAGGRLTAKEAASEHGVSFRAGIFPVKGQDLYCGIFVDISEEERARQRLRDLSASTLERAQEVISRQMQAAQEIAHLLGESTAETKVLLVKLMSLFKEKGRL